MIAPISNFLAMISGDGRRNKVVPPTGFTATLSTATSAIMAFLVVFALVLSRVDYFDDSGKCGDDYAGRACIHGGQCAGDRGSTFDWSDG